MKVTINIDCTPQEARAFFGLPDVTKLHEAMMAEMQRRMSQGLSAEEMEALFRLWMPAGGKAWEGLQSMFWPTAQMSDKK
jgi:hypothetical protein